MTKNKNSVQGLIGLERFTRFGVKTDKVELVVFQRRTYQYFRAVSSEYRRQNTSSYDVIEYHT